LIPRCCVAKIIAASSKQSSVDVDQASLLARLILKLRLIASGALHGGANETAKSSEVALVVSASRLAC
jgi:hypothetical protein